MGPETLHSLQIPGVANTAALQSTYWFIGARLLPKIGLSLMYLSNVKDLSTLSP